MANGVNFEGQKFYVVYCCGFLLFKGLGFLKFGRWLVLLLVLALVIRSRVLVWGGGGVKWFTVFRVVQVGRYALFLSSRCV